MNTLNIGSKYYIRYPKSNILFIWKLIAKHETTLSYEKSLTFIDNYGNKLIITNGIYNKINIFDYVEQPPPPLPLLQLKSQPSQFQYLPSQNINIIVEEDDLCN